MGCQRGTHGSPLVAHDQSTPTQTHVHQGCMAESRSLRMQKQLETRPWSHPVGALCLGAACLRTVLGSASWVATQRTCIGWPVPALLEAAVLAELQAAAICRSGRCRSNAGHSHHSHPPPAASHTTAVDLVARAAPPRRAPPGATCMRNPCVSVSCAVMIYNTAEWNTE